MRNIILFIVLHSFILSPELVFGRTREVPVRSARSLRQQVDSYAELLFKEVENAKTTKDQLHSIQRVLSQLKALNQSAGPGSQEDESYVRSVLSSLDSLPKEKKFKKQECASIRASYLANFEPESQGEPQAPALKIAWKVLGSICK